MKAKSKQGLLFATLVFILFYAVYIKFPQLVEPNALSLVNEELKATVLLSTYGKAYFFNLSIMFSCCFQCSLTS